MAVIKAVTVTNPAIVFLMKFINGLGSFDESLPQNIKPVKKEETSIFVLILLSLFSRSLQNHFIVFFILSPSKIIYLNFIITY